MLGIFGLDGFFLYDFSNGPFGGDSFNDFVIGTTWIFRFFFLVCLDIQNHSDHWCFPDTNPLPKKIAEFIPHSEIASSCKFYRQFFVSLLDFWRKDLNLRSLWAIDLVNVEGTMKPKN